MILQYQLTFEDMLALQKDFIQMTTYHRRKAKLAFIVFTLFSFFLFFNLLFEVLIFFFSLNIVVVTIATSGAILATVLILPFLRNLYSKITIRQYKKAFKKNKDLDWPKEYTATLNEEGIELNVDNSKVKGKSQFSWKAFHKASEDEERYFLYYTQTDALILPKKADSIYVEDIKTLLLQHLGQLLEQDSTKR